MHVFLSLKGRRPVIWRLNFLPKYLQKNMVTENKDHLRSSSHYIVKYLIICDLLRLPLAFTCRAVASSTFKRNMKFILDLSQDFDKDLKENTFILCLYTRISSKKTMVAFYEHRTHQLYLDPCGNSRSTSSPEKHILLPGYTKAFLGRLIWGNSIIDAWRPSMSQPLQYSTQSFL